MHPAPSYSQMLSPRRKIVIYLSALAAMFMSVLDMQIIATALPTIADELGNLELFGWVGAAYLLATAAVTPFYGKLGDLFGRKRVFIAAIALFVIGSLACAQAWSMQSLIAARVLQGLGGGGLMTSAFAIIADLFEPRERARYQGYSTAVFTLSNLVGPVAGGLIAQSIGWEYIFLINLPIGIAVVAVVLIAMPTTVTARQPMVDYMGGLLLAAAVTLTVFWAEEVLAGGRSAGVLAYLLPILALAAGFAFVAVERRAAEPMVPLHLFGNRTIAIALAISTIAGISTLGMLNYFALFLQTVTGLPPALAGLLFLPASIGSLAASIGSGILVSRTGRYKPYPVLSMALGAVVMLVFTFVDASTPIWMIGGLMFFFSVSIGLQMQTLMAAVQNAAPRQDIGAATGAINLARMIGASLGLAANGGLLTAGLARAQAGLPSELSARLPGEVGDLTPEVISTLPPDLAAEVVMLFGQAFDSIYYFGAVLFAAGFVLALLLKDVRLPVHEKPSVGTGQQPDAAPVSAGE